MKETSKGRGADSGDFGLMSHRACDMRAESGVLPLHTLEYGHG